jgi:long-chain acyl-CoA synthetase
VSSARNLARLAEAALERRGDHPALWFEGVWQSAGELAARAERVAAGLVAHGVRPGDRVVVKMENSPDVVVAYHAIWRIGAVVTPAIFLLTPEELDRLVADAEPALVLTSDSFPAFEIDATQPIVERDDADLAALVYTGGTTGRAKGVMLTHANLFEAGRAGIAAGHVDGIDRSLSCLPLAHSYGLLVLAVGLQHPGTPQSFLMRWFDPELWLQLAQEHRAQIAPVVPSMLYLLLAQPL